MTCDRIPEPESIPTRAYNVGGGHKWTFEDTKARRWVEHRLEGRVLNACAGATTLRHDDEIVRNDLDEEMDADYHLRVRDLPDELGENEFQTVVYDPPWSIHQSNEEYGGRMVGKDRIMAEAISKLLKPGGVVLGFGYQSAVMPADLGFECTEIAVFRVIGRRKDFFGVRDRAPNASLAEF